MPPELPWPRKDNELFIDGHDSWHNARVGWFEDEWFGYTEGYRIGADLLVQHVVDTQSNQDFLVYPIIFLYRQALEVSLKYLIFSGNMLFDTQPNIPKHHRLVSLWQVCRPIIEQVWPEGPKKDLDAVGKVLKQFDAKDPVSTVFRYPVDKAGKASMPNAEQINIRNFAEVTNRVLSLLNGCGAGISEYMQNNKKDMER